MIENRSKAFMYRGVRVHPATGEPKHFECRRWHNQREWWLVPSGMGNWIPAATKTDARKKIDEWRNEQ